MGLFDLEGTSQEKYPDNKGGRPTKEEEEDDYDRLRRIEEESDLNVFRINHGKDFWKNEWNRFYDNDKHIKEVISDICGHTMTLPNTAVSQIHDHGIHDFRDHEDDYPESIRYISKQDKQSSSNDEGSELLNKLMSDEDEQDNEPEDDSGGKGVKALLDDI